MLHYYLTDTPQVQAGDKAVCGHVSDGEQSGGKDRCPICLAIVRSRGLEEGQQPKAV